MSISEASSGTYCNGYRRSHDWIKISPVAMIPIAFIIMTIINVIVVVVVVEVECFVLLNVWI